MTICVGVLPQQMNLQCKGYKWNRALVATVHFHSSCLSYDV